MFQLLAFESEILPPKLLVSKGNKMTAVTADWVVDGQDYYIEIADNVQLSVASTCQLSGSAGSVVTLRSDLIGWFDAPAHALRFSSF